VCRVRRRIVMKRGRKIVKRESEREREREDCKEREREREESKERESNIPIRPSDIVAAV
jgi:hypothetical protein